jgi:hypothetical protein
MDGTKQKQTTQSANVGACLRVDYFIFVAFLHELSVCEKLPSFFFSFGGKGRDGEQIGEG